MHADSAGPSGEGETTRAAQRLTELPSLEATQAQLTSVVEQLGAYIATLVPGIQWRWNREQSRSGCARPYDRTGGANLYLRNYLGDKPIPAEVWPRVVDRARELAATLGATGAQTFRDDPGNKDARFYSPEGTAISLGYQVNTVIAADTGCRLPAGGATSPPATR